MNHGSACCRVFVGYREGARSSNLAPLSKNTIRGAAVAGATALAVVGLAVPAQAASATVYTTTNGGMMSYVDAPTDYFRIDDHYHDGYGVRGELRSGGGTLLSWMYVEGSGEYRTWNYDLAKGKDYVIRVCLGEGALDTTLINCRSKVVRDE